MKNKSKRSLKTKHSRKGMLTLEERQEERYKTIWKSRRLAMTRRREAKHRRSTIGEVLHVTPYKGGGNLSEVSDEQLTLKAAKRQDLISNKTINKGKGRSAKGNKQGEFN